MLKSLFFISAKVRDNGLARRCWTASSPSVSRWEIMVWPCDSEQPLLRHWEDYDLVKGKGKVASIQVGELLSLSVSRWEIMVLSKEKRGMASVQAEEPLWLSRWANNGWGHQRTRRVASIQVEEPLLLRERIMVCFIKWYWRAVVLSFYTILSLLCF